MWCFSYGNYDAVCVRGERRARTRGAKGARRARARDDDDAF